MRKFIVGIVILTGTIQNIAFAEKLIEDGKDVNIHRPEESKLNFNKLKPEEPGLEEPERCPICLEYFQKKITEQVTKTLCGHEFHTDCLSKCYQKKCPLCKNSIALPPRAPLPPFYYPAVQPGDSEFVSLQGFHFREVSDSNVRGALGVNARRMPDDTFILGELEKGEDGSVLIFENQNDAIQHCSRKGASLPTENDYKNLRKWLGATMEFKKGYIAQDHIIPHLSIQEFLLVFTPNIGMYIKQITFDGKYGAFSFSSGDAKGAARCIIRNPQSQVHR